MMDSRGSISQVGWAMPITTLSNSANVLKFSSLFFENYKIEIKFAVYDIDVKSQK